MSRTPIFRDLHSNPHQPLILANVWDAGGARLVESLGARAVATTSAGVAWAKGYPDGNVMPAQLLAHLAGEIIRAVQVPVTIDVEGGYSDDPSVVAENLRPIIATGISGINIEDGAGEMELLAKKITAIKKIASSEGSDIFVNARTDVYLEDLAPDNEKPREVLKRASIYQNAGADGLFVPGMTGVADIGVVTQGTALPVNLMASPSLPKLDALVKLNVRRLSSGGTLAQIAYKHLGRLAASFLKEGDCAVLKEDAMTYSELQALF